MSITRARIRSGSWIYAVTGDLSGQKVTPETEIAEDTYPGRYLHLTEAKKVVIERKVMSADSVYVADNYREDRDLGCAVEDQSVRARGKLRICEGALIGEEDRTLGGIRIGKNAVIGANAVVARDVSDYSVAVGIPAMVVRRHSPTTQKWETEL